MPTTSNFGWTTPADTDLVKDGAAAIRTLGNGIDTSLVDLKGGTTGQVLSKTSNTDLDYTWITPNVGDITEVQAGTGISVASGTGPIPVITNTVATTFDAAGDLVYGTGADTFTKLALGTAGQVLKVNSGATAPEWGAAAAGALTLITSTTVSAATSKSVDNCFSSTYANYLIKINLTSGAANNADVTMRLRTSSTDSSTSYKQRRLLANQNGVSTDLDTSGTDEWYIFANDSSYVNSYDVFINNPFATVYTTWWGGGSNVYSGFLQNLTGCGYHSANTSYDGFTLLSNANMTGTIRVYGYQNS